MLLFGSARKRARYSNHRRLLKRELPMNDEMVVENEEPQVGHIPAAADVAVK